MSRKMFSAGETQLLILSIIYGFVKLSKMTIPLVFDTLLGRLDDTHRKNVLVDYLPNISDQVIILATDSEINSEDERIIDNYVSKKYELKKFESNQNLMISWGELWITN